MVATKLENEIVQLAQTSIDESVSAHVIALAEVRKQALAQFEHLGFPSIKHEEWKYTSTKLFSALEPEAFLAKSADAATSLNFTVPQAPYLVVLDGEPAWSLSDLNGLAKGVIVKSFDQLGNDELSGLAAHYGTLSQAETNAFDALNTALANNGIFISAAKNSLQESPLHLVHVFTEPDRVSHTRLAIHVASGAELRISHDFVSQADATLGTLVSEAWVEANGRLHADVLEQAIGTALYGGWYVHQQDDSHATYVTITTEGRWVRNNLHITIAGKNAEGNMMGLYLGKDRNLIDNHTLVDHQQPNSQSNELYKGVVNDRSTAVFNGKIFVKQAAQKTNAFQSNRNILLSDDASVNTKPQLEIFADDVKCSHGATTGALDEEPIFYLRARGLSYDQAKALLLHAYANEVLDHLKSSFLHEEASLALEKYLA